MLRSHFKKICGLLICMACVICTVGSARVTGSAEECPYTREEFLQILEDAEVAAVMYTRPENNTNSRVAEIDRLFIPKFRELSAVYEREDNKARLIGGFSRPAAFKSFLEQYFTDSVISSLANEAVIFDYDEDQVYWRYVTPQYSYDVVGNAEYTFPVFSAEKIECHAVFTFEHDLTGAFDYIFEKTDNGWRFSSFATRVSVYERLLTESVDPGDAAASDSAAQNISSAAGPLAAIVLLAAAAFYMHRRKDKKQAGRVFSVLLSAVICISAAGCVSRSHSSPAGIATADAGPVTAGIAGASSSPNAADGHEPDESDWEYITYDGATAIITGYTGNAADVAIPEKIGGYTVATAEACFKDSANAEKILSLSVPAIKYDARLFDGLTGLKELTIETVPEQGRDGWPAAVPESVKNVLAGIARLTVTKDTKAVPGFLTLCAGLKTVIFSSGLETVEDDAFSGLISLETVETPAAPKTIGDNAFRGCTALSAYPAGDRTVSIGNYAFCGCSSLTGELEIGENVTYVGKYAFFGCDSITRVRFNAPSCRVEPLSAERAGGTLCFGMHGLQEVEIGEKVTELAPFLLSGGTFSSVSVKASGLKNIGEGSFACCPKLKEIALPEMLEVIGKDAFYGCCSLQGISFPGSLVSVGEYAFMNCDRLKTIDTGTLDILPEGIFCGCADLTTLTLDCSMIGDRAFYLCTGLVKVELPENVSLGRDAFGLCPGLSN